MLASADAAPLRARAPTPPAAPAPVPAAAAATTDAEWSYRVSAGDTLIGLANTYLKPGFSWQQLQKLNAVADPYRLPPGKAMRIPLAWLRGESTVAEAVFVRGDVQVQRGGAGAAEALAVGATLQPGDLVRTGAQSSVTVKFADSSRLLVVPDSQVRVERLMVFGTTGLTDTRLKLEKGGADSQVQPGKQVPGYRIETPAVNLGVRGTEFRVRLTGDKSSSFEVLQGSVGGAGTVGAEVAVGAGFGATAVAGAPMSAPQALLPAPSLASLAPKLERVPLTPAWTPLPGAVAYRAQVVAEGAPDQLLLDGSFTAPQAKWADLPDGRYQLRVRAVDAQGLEGRHADASFTLKARPEPPFSVKPAAAAKVYGTAVELGWTQSAAAARYHLQVSATPDFVQTAADVSDIKEPQAKLDLPHGSYHWRVASVTASGDHGPWGDPQGFTLRPVPPSPPAEPPQVNDKALVFRWRVSEGASYQVQIARDAQFKDLVQDKTTRDASIELATPQPGSYHMRVRTIDPDGFAGAYGGTQSVEVPRPSRWWIILPLLLPLLLL